MEISTLASMMALSREGHIKEVLRMFSFLKSRHNDVMVFDTTDPEINESQFTCDDWSASAYVEYNEELTSNVPEPRGLGFIIRVFIDSDFAGDCATRRSRAGYIRFLNGAHIY